MKLIFGVFIVSIIFYAGCSKNNNIDILKSVSVFSIIPTSGPANTIVVIKGANFDPDITNNLVKFNGDSASVLSGSDDSLAVQAPAYGSSGPVTVTVNGKTATGPIFTYINDSVDVYAAAAYDGVVYWKNGTKVFLGPTESSSGGAYGLAISDTDIYVGGYVHQSVSGYGYDRAAIWKNGQKIFFSEPDSIARLRTLILSGSDIYAGGSQNNAPVYWKNGITKRFPVPSTGYGRINALAVNGNNVYAAGFESGNANDQNLVYWKNGIKTILGTQGMVDVGATSIALDGTDVYICGTDSGDAVYWKNGVKIILSKFSGQDPAEANAIAISGNSVYVAGYISGHPVYWKDGVQFNLPHGSFAKATAITFYQSDIYIGGIDWDSPVYWKNGVENSLCCGFGSFINAIVVIKN